MSYMFSSYSVFVQPHLGSSLILAFQLWPGANLTFLASSETLYIIDVYSIPRSLFFFLKFGAKLPIYINLWKGYEVQGSIWQSVLGSYGWPRRTLFGHFISCHIKNVTCSDIYGCKVLGADGSGVPLIVEWPQWVASFSIREADLLQNGWIFGKVPRGGVIFNPKIHPFWRCGREVFNFSLGPIPHVSILQNFFHIVKSWIPL